MNTARKLIVIFLIVIGIGASCTPPPDTEHLTIICCEPSGQCYLPQTYVCGDSDTSGVDDIDDTFGDVREIGLGDAEDTDLDTGTADGEGADVAVTDTTPSLWPEVDVPDIAETEPGQYVILVTEIDRDQLKDRKSSRYPVVTTSIA